VRATETNPACVTHCPQLEKTRFYYPDEQLERGGRTIVLDIPGATPEKKKREWRRERYSTNRLNTNSNEWQIELGREYNRGSNKGGKGKKNELWLNVAKEGMQKRNRAD